MAQARKNVEIVARGMRAQAERWASEHLVVASRDVARLVELRDTMQRDLGRLSQSLLAGLHTENAPEDEDRADGGTS